LYLLTALERHHRVPPLLDVDAPDHRVPGEDGTRERRDRLARGLISPPTAVPSVFSQLDVNSAHVYVVANR